MSTTTPNDCEIVCDNNVCRISKKKCCPVSGPENQPVCNDRPVHPETRNLNDLLSSFIDKREKRKSESDTTESVETEEEELNEEDEDLEVKMLYKLVESHAELCKAFNSRYNR